MTIFWVLSSHEIRCERPETLFLLVYAVASGLYLLVRQKNAELLSREIPLAIVNV